MLLWQWGVWEGSGTGEAASPCSFTRCESNNTIGNRDSEDVWKSFTEEVMHRAPSLYNVKEKGMRHVVNTRDPKYASHQAIKHFTKVKWDAFMENPWAERSLMQWQQIAQQHAASYVRFKARFIEDWTLHGKRVHTSCFPGHHMGEITPKNVNKSLCLWDVYVYVSLCKHK